MQAVSRTTPPALLPNTVLVLRRATAGLGAARISRVEGANYGPRVATSPVAQWERNVRLMRAAAARMTVPAWYSLPL